MWDLRTELENNEALILWIQSHVALGEYRFTYHAEIERDNDHLTVEEIEQALLSRIEIIENYPKDPRGPSCLALGFTETGKPIHIVCGSNDPEMVVVVTVYIPDKNLWLDNRIRKEQL